jgi:regulatory protein
MRGTITALEPQERRGGKRVNVFLDGRYAFSLDAEVALGLRVGEEVTDTTAAAVLERDQLQTALDAALTFLGHRPRSEQEIRRRLARKALPPTIVEQVLARLREYGLVNDEAFARYWVEQRQTFRPRGARLLKAELRQRGVPTDLAAEVAEETEGSADEDAYRAAQKKASQLASVDERTFRTRLAQFLGRRGFDWDAIAPTVQRLWEEVSTAEAREDTMPARPRRRPSLRGTGRGP